MPDLDKKFDIATKDLSPEQQKELTRILNRSDYLFKVKGVNEANRLKMAQELTVLFYETLLEEEKKHVKP